MGSSIPHKVVECITNEWGCPDMTDALVQLRDVGVWFGAQTVLSHIHLDILPAQIVTLIGPNGAGKSTLARVILGLCPVSIGTVVWRPQLRMAYTPQRIALDPILPIRIRRFLQLSERYTSDQLDFVLAQVGLSTAQDPLLATLSGGQLQRVLLARALLRKPDLLVLDEPTQGVDLIGQAEFYRLIAQIRQSQGCGILLISHDLNVVMAETEHVVCLNQHICCSGCPEVVRQDPAFIALFGASGHRLARYVHHHNHHHPVCDEDRAS